ncbi:MAG: serine protease [Bacteroides sp.]|nr:serine protease [Bacillota bacterium]MCM1393895.1 serine protease [[Eubacterium] siraeum]MCM1455327.1 serine protease [Bacteroides sp.]
MDDFNNFFDEQPSREPVRTPIYHTPEPKHSGKSNLNAIICLVIAVIMCVLVIVNVIVLATLKNSIAAEYANSMEASMREQYYSAISDSLSDTNVVEDVTNTATTKVIDALDTTIGEIAENYASGVARLYMYTSSLSAKADGLATGFLISDTNEDGTLGRYIVTNAHCVRFATAHTTYSPYYGKTPRIEWASYGKITAVFEEDETTYTTEIVAYGAYSTTVEDQYHEEYNASAENDQPDLAILRITGNQPSNEQHVSLKLASNDYSIKRGTPVALIGNPEGIGDTNSITSGTISNVGIRVSSWGSGSFIMTDAAVNSGNSGGPMLDRRGVVLGVVESKLVSDDIDNMGFALSASTLCDFIEWAKTNNVLNSTVEINCTFVS